MVSGFEDDYDNQTDEQADVNADQVPDSEELPTETDSDSEVGVSQTQVTESDGTDTDADTDADTDSTNSTDPSPGVPQVDSVASEGLFSGTLQYGNDWWDTTINLDGIDTEFNLETSIPEGDADSSWPLLPSRQSSEDYRTERRTYQYQEETINIADETYAMINGATDQKVYKTDFWEAMALVAVNNPEQIAYVLQFWGYDF